MAVDIGCGTGQATLALAQHFDRVVGIDISENQISEAGKSIDGDEKLRETIEFRWSAIGYTPSASTKETEGFWRN